MTFDGRRYIVCRNRPRPRRTPPTGRRSCAALERSRQGDKALVGNPGYRRFLKATSDEPSRSMPLGSPRRRGSTASSCCAPTPPSTRSRPCCATATEDVEQLFRSAKSLLATRPIFHKRDATIRGHVFCSFLALVLQKALEDHIAAIGRPGSWPQIIADLDSLTETEIAYDGKRFVVRSAPRPAASLALRAAGVALPPTVRDAAAS